MSPFVILWCAYGPICLFVVVQRFSCIIDKNWKHFCSVPLPDLIAIPVDASLPATREVVLFRWVPIKVAYFHDKTFPYVGNIAFEIGLQDLDRAPAMHTRTSSHSNELCNLVM
jgi:hypothetical protein